jgi:hypothetical protein
VNRSIAPSFFVPALDGKLSGQFHATAALSPVKELTAPIVGLRAGLDAVEKT